MAEFKILKIWEIETSINWLLHSTTAEYYSRVNNTYMIPIIILSSTTGTLGLVNANGNSLIIHDINITSIFIGLFGFIGAMMTTIYNFLGIQRLQSTHTFHSIEYNKIARDIKIHIYLSETDQKIHEHAKEYIKQCRVKIDKLMETAPEIPQHITLKLKMKIDAIENDDTCENRLSMSRISVHKDTNPSLPPPPSNPSNSSNQSDTVDALDSSYSSDPLEPPLSNSIDFKPQNDVNPVIQHWNLVRKHVVNSSNFGTDEVMIDVNLEDKTNQKSEISDDELNEDEQLKKIKNYLKNDSSVNSKYIRQGFENTRNF